MTQRKNVKHDEVIDREVLAKLLEAIPPVAPSADLRAKVLERIRSPGPQKDLFTIRTEGGDWKQLAPGIEVKLLLFDKQDNTVSFLLRAQPGVSMPGHEHHAYEECLVLEGEFSIGDLTLRAGDFHCAPKGTVHTTAHTQTGVLVYLRASIEDYPGVHA